MAPVDARHLVDELYAEALQITQQEAIAQQREGASFFIAIAQALVNNREAVEQAIFEVDSSVIQLLEQTSEYTVLGNALDTLINNISVQLSEHSPIRVLLSGVHSAEFVTRLKQGDKQAHSKLQELIQQDEEYLTLLQEETACITALNESAILYAQCKNSLVERMRYVPEGLTLQISQEQAQQQVLSVLKSVSALGKSNHEAIRNSIARFRANTTQFAQHMVAEQQEKQPDAEQLQSKTEELVRLMPGNNGKEYVLPDTSKSIAVRKSIAKIVEPVLQATDVPLTAHIRELFLAVVSNSQISIGQLETVAELLPTSKDQDTLDKTISEAFAMFRIPTEKPQKKLFLIRRLFGIEPFNLTFLLCFGKTRQQLATQFSAIFLNNNGMFYEPDVNKLESDFQKTVQEYGRTKMAFNISYDALVQTGALKEYREDRLEFQKQVTLQQSTVLATLRDPDPEGSFFTEDSNFRTVLSSSRELTRHFYEWLSVQTAYLTQPAELTEQIIKQTRRIVKVGEFLQDIQTRIAEYATGDDQELLNRFEHIIVIDTQYETAMQSFEKTSQKIKSSSTAHVIKFYRDSIQTPQLVQKVQERLRELKQQIAEEYASKKLSEDSQVNTALQAIIRTFQEQMSTVTHKQELRSAVREKLDTLEVQLFEREKDELENESSILVHECEVLLEITKPITGSYSQTDAEAGYYAWLSRKQNVKNKLLQLIEKRRKFNTSVVQSPVSSRVSLLEIQLFESHIGSELHTAANLQRIIFNFLTERHKMRDRLQSMSSVKQIWDFIHSDEHAEFFAMQFPRTAVKRVNESLSMIANRGVAFGMVGLVQHAVKRLGQQWQRSELIGSQASFEYTMPDYLAYALPIVADREAASTKHSSVAERIVQHLQEFRSFKDLSELIGVFTYAVNQGVSNYIVAVEAQSGKEVTLRDIHNELVNAANLPIEIFCEQEPLAICTERFSRRIQSTCAAIPGLSQTALKLYKQQPIFIIAEKMLSFNNYERNLSQFLTDLNTAGGSVLLFAPDERRRVTASQLAVTINDLQNASHLFIKKKLIGSVVISRDEANKVVEDNLGNISNPVVSVAANLLHQWYVFQQRGKKVY